NAVFPLTKSKPAPATSSTAREREQRHQTPEMHDGHQRPASGRWLLLRIAAARTQRIHRRVNSRVREIQRGQGQNRELQAFRFASALKPPPSPAPNHPRKAGVVGSNPTVGFLS